MGNFAFLKFNPCCSVYPRTAARQIRSYESSAENPSAPAIGAQYLNVLPIMENWCSHWKKQRQSPAGTSCRHSPQKIRCSGAFLQLHRSWQESHSGCHLRNHLLAGMKKAHLHGTDRLKMGIKMGIKIPRQISPTGLLPIIEFYSIRALCSP